MTICAADPSHIDGIWDLQTRNLISNLPETERANGFVTTPFTVAQLERLLDEDGVFVALQNEKVIGYALAGSWDYFSQWPIFPFMLARLPALHETDWIISPDNSFQYGPVCLDEEHRGSGLFPRLFEHMRLALSQRYAYGVTFINRVNQRSYAAHTQKLGMQVIDRFEFDGRSFYSLAFDTQTSVLAVR